MVAIHCRGYCVDLARSPDRAPIRYVDVVRKSFAQITILRVCFFNGQNVIPAEFFSSMNLSALGSCYSVYCLWKSRSSLLKSSETHDCTMFCFHARLYTLFTTTVNWKRRARFSETLRGFRPYTTEQRVAHYENDKSRPTPAKRGAFTLIGYTSNRC